MEKGAATELQENKKVWKQKSVDCKIFKEVK